MKAIVHIGTEKTGTTSIQKYLFQNRKKLRKAGFHFLQSAGSTNNRALPAYFVAESRFDDFYRDEGITTIEAKAEFRNQFLQKFEHEIGTLPKNIHTVVISSEHFHSRLRTPEEVDKVHEFLTSYFDDIRIVCYLRDQLSTCSSYYSTGLKSGNPATFAEFFQRCNSENYYFNYYEVLSNWERRFGFGSLDVSLFSRKSFLNNSLLDDFTAKLDPALVGVLDSEIDVENESLTPIGQALARGVNLAFPVRTSRPELAKIREKCKSGIYQRYRGPGRQPSLAMQKRIYLDFSESNELLREKYFPDLALLFDPPVEEPAPLVGIEDKLIEGLSALFGELRKLGKDVIEADEYNAVTRNILYGVLDVFTSEDDIQEDGSVDAKGDLNKDKSKSKKKGISAVISKADLRLLLFTANSVESKDLKMAKDVLTLVQEIDPSTPSLTAKLEAIERKEGVWGQTRYAITYSSISEASDPEERQKQSEQFYAWLTSFADYIDGGAINVLKDANSLRLESAAVIRKPSISGGFTIVRVDSEETAYSIAARCPYLSYGGTVFVSEVLQITP